MDADDIDLTLLDLFEYGEDHGIGPFQMHRYLQERITEAYLAVSDLEDRLAHDPMPSITIH